ncbi:MAG: hypothetical protein ACYTHM_25045, partial [Planctomycetota bacterium]
GIPAELQSICLKAMRLKKEERYGSVEALIGDVRAFQDHRPVRAHRYGLPARFVRFVRRHPAGSLAGGVAVVLLSIGAAVTGMLLSYAETLAAREVAAKAQADAAAVRAAKESDRADEAEVKKGIALGRARTAEDMLEKGRKVAAVLKAAETELGEVHRALKNASLSPEAATSLPAAWEKHASRIEAHEATVPEDPASRATWYAAKGWLNTIAGRPEIGKDLFQQARTEDPDVAAGWLFEAMTCLAEYYRSQPSAKATIHEEGLVLKVVPGETETMRGARKRFEILLDEARKDRVWGLTAAEQFLEALGGARAFQALDLAGAEKGFSKALAIPEAVWMREEIWMMRARIRSLAGDVEGGLTDVRNAIEVLPDALALRVDLGLLEYQKAGAEAKAGRDPFVWYGRAALSISRVVEKGSKDASLVARNLRSIVYLSWGTAAVEKGKDPIPAFGKSLEDLTVLIDAFPDDPELLRLAGMTHTRLGAALHNAGQASAGNFRKALAFFEAAVEKGAKEIHILDGRGAAALHLATALADRGEDPVPLLERAFADTDRLVREFPESGQVRFNRGSVHLNRAVAELERRRDPRSYFTAALADFEKALALGHDRFTVLSNRSTAFTNQGRFEAGAGLDPRASFEKALADGDAVVKLAPENPEAYLSRAQALNEQAYYLLVQRRDPTAPYRRAMKDCSEAIRLRPGHAKAYARRGQAHRYLGIFLSSRGEDPTAQFKD